MFPPEAFARYSGMRLAPQAMAGAPERKEHHRDELFQGAANCPLTDTKPLQH
jgi:hypothetical protein